MTVVSDFFNYTQTVELIEIYASDFEQQSVSEFGQIGKLVVFI